MNNYNYIQYAPVSPTDTLAKVSIVDTILSICNIVCLFFLIAAGISIIIKKIRKKKIHKVEIAICIIAIIVIAVICVLQSIAMSSLDGNSNISIWSYLINHMLSILKIYK